MSLIHARRPVRAPVPFPWTYALLLFLAAMAGVLMVAPVLIGA